MIKDPSTGWDGGPFPYDALAEVGVTPRTSHADLQDASFELLARRLMTPVTQQAWDELRVVRRRMVVELLLHDVDLESAVPAAEAALDRALAAAEHPEPTAIPLPEETARLLDDLITFDT
ncbi:hypothetical protein GCM10009837_17280 [Streptomyces durmitorensis]|uniref:Uncharacterized protein n=1 Tax=Streptomyces durmitorensis TaxID=319947 RepID=A0ABY4PPA9_9ACTN|nr:hypothetical protein [Streptomyces durmitorensis]UQT55576.1 hypothetical protein M4V62_10995 [Streptomyces durmitorensis]